MEGAAGRLVSGELSSGEVPVEVVIEGGEKKKYFVNYRLDRISSDTM